MLGDGVFEVVLFLVSAAVPLSDYVNSYTSAHAYLRFRKATIPSTNWLSIRCFLQMWKRQIPQHMTTYHKCRNEARER